MKTLKGKICLVTGATRGIGRGIALQLGEAGATVYITGRTLTTPPDDPVGGSLTDTAAEIEKRGGECIPIQCDHSKDEDVKKLFERVKSEQNGKLDLLVNNAYAAVSAIADHYKVPFWEQPLDIWDTVNNVGLRNTYMCAAHASKLMVPSKQGLIVNISSAGGLVYLFNVAYGVGKEACDRMAADCSVELKKHNVAFVSLWPGPVKTEKLLYNFQINKYGDGSESAHLKEFFLNHGESTEYAGKCIVHLASDPNIMKKSGRILLAADVGDEYGFVDIDGRTPYNMRCISDFLKTMKMNWLAWITPRCLKLPLWVLPLMGNKFKTPSVYTMEK
ncbi:dehydrogenase/reductase SDR family member 1-like [Gigantopelta aegis]|uniref:dehydrogenase/reductase SDR family member 1-like n=1 Tax=Gigantopelta aegis TaxID=1735272 RepID=UPI001B88CD61|nr:dehydrogenase/reductase SDR family member 1-like [Gigantopelta aegis]